MIEKWLRKIFTEEVAKIPPPKVDVHTLRFDDAGLLEKMEELQVANTNRWLFTEARFDDLEKTVQKLGAPIAEEEQLLQAYEAVSYAVTKVEGDKQLMEHEYLRIPEAMEWAGHYLHMRGWESPGIPNLEKLVRWKFSFNEGHREFISKGSKARTMP